MRADLVVDASVLARILYREDGAEAARNALLAAGGLLAPDLIHFEIASVGVKRIQRGHSTQEQVAEALKSVGSLLDEVVSGASLVRRALELAVPHQLSAYDASYLALAEARRIRLITADRRLAQRCVERGFGDLVTVI